jgi:hypothetical protein
MLMQRMSGKFPRDGRKLPSAVSASGQPDNATRPSSVIFTTTTSIIQFQKCRVGLSREPLGKVLSMDLGYVTSLLIAGLAVVSIFVEIPYVSDYAFWVLLAAYLLVIYIARENGRKLNEQLKKK